MRSKIWRAPDDLEYDEPNPICPICGQPADDGYYDKDGKLVGCDCCISRRSWEDVPEFFPEQ